MASRGAEEELSGRERGRFFALFVPLSILAAGAFLRAYRYGAPGFWIDEYGTWWTVATARFPDMVQRVLAVQAESPLAYLPFWWSARVFGTSPAALRLAPLLLGIGTVALAYPLGTTLLGTRRGGLVSLLAFALSTKLIWYAQEARPYQLALFFCVLSFLCYARLAERESVRWRALWILATTLAFYFHYLFGFILVIQLADLLAGRPPAPARRAWGISFAAVLALGIPGGIHLLSIAQRRGSLNWMAPQEWWAGLQVGALLLDPWVFSATAFTVLAVGTTDRSIPPRARRLLLLWFPGTLLAIGAAQMLLGLGMLQVRYILYVLPAALLVTAWLIGSAARPAVPLAVYVLLTLAWNLIPPYRGVGTFSPRPEEGWERAAARLQRDARPEDLILFRSGFVEADHIARADPDPLAVEFVRWPLLAHLGGRPFRLASVPYRETDLTRPYLSRLVDLAAASPRVWIVGDDAGAGLASVPGLLRELSSRAAFHIQETPVGTVRVVLLTRDG